jgi:hypothetical protein
VRGEEGEEEEGGKKRRGKEGGSTRRANENYKKKKKNKQPKQARFQIVIFSFLPSFQIVWTKEFFFAFFFSSPQTHFFNNDNQ